MRLISFQIKGFKSIIDSGECILSQKDAITVLAGQNEAGKSAVLEALDFFRNGPGTDFVKLQKRLDSTVTEVVCKFSLDEEDIKKVKQGFNDERINKFFDKQKSIIAKRIWQEGNSATGELLIESNTFEQFKFDTLKSPPSGELPESDPQTQTSKEDVINVLKQKMLDCLPVVTLYRYFSDFLPSEIVVSEIPTNSAVIDFEKVFGVNLTQIANITDPRQLSATKETLEDKATDDFNKSWSQKISLSDETKYKFAIDVNQQEPKKVIFMIKGGDNKPLFLEQKSMGFRWFSAFHLRLRALGVDDNNKSNLILLVDEPGQNLHEMAQLDAKRVLEELAQKGIQILYSTHNAKLIGTEGQEYLRIRLVSNSKDNGTKVETISQFASHSEKSNLDALSPIITAMGLSGISAFVERDRFNVVVEGVTDHYYLSAFRKLLNKSEKLFFVPAVGANNIPNVVSVLLGWGYNFRAVFDDDKGSGRKAYNQLKKDLYNDSDEIAHDYIYKLPDCNGIEDIFSKNDFYSLVLNTQIDTSNSAKNSDLAKGKKEILAREFLERVSNESLSLDAETSRRVEAVFVWLYEKFKIS